MSKKNYLLAALMCCVGVLFAQKAVIRGNVFDQKDGAPLPFSSVMIEGTAVGAITDLDGFFTLADLKAGTYSLKVTSIGYDSSMATVSVNANSVAYQKFFLSESEATLKEVVVSSTREIKRTEVRISRLSVTPKMIKSMPSTGGEPDIVQYLQVLPGVISTGDQGGQLYIRGGAPVQNRMMIDGMTIYNPFHSIGFFSVFETEAIKNVEVTTGGFNAEHGSRISAVVDIKTREGNRKKFSGVVSGSPFMAKALLEGPIIPLKNEDDPTVSFLVTAKHSYLDRTGNIFYPYAARDSTGLPFSFTDVYGKVTMMTSNGSKLNLFGFNFNDSYDQKNVSSLNWNAQGGGANFTLIPNNVNFVINGTVSASNYFIDLLEFDKSQGEFSPEPRKSDIQGFNAMVDFTNFGDDSEIKYGFEINGFRTNFQYKNPLGLNFGLFENTTEIAGFVKYRKKYGRFVIEPGLRTQYYVSLNTPVIEPRIGVKINASKRFRIKFASGVYSQNLISTVNEDDIVNLFVGFLSSPAGDIYKPGTKDKVDSRLQRAIHVVGGFEIDVNDRLELNIEPYFKRFTQLMNLNRNKFLSSDPDFVTETGNAYGLDISAKYEGPSYYLWATYSNGHVNRNNGETTYPTNFDRRHNVNLLFNYNFGKDKNWEFGTRWNYGSGFAFTLTQGFYNYIPFSQGLDTDILGGNDQIGVILSDNKNSGRLSDYHRLDMSLKRKIVFSKTTDLTINASVTNAYIYQLPFIIYRC